jgi:hypothetical protein
MMMADKPKDAAWAAENIATDAANDCLYAPFDGSNPTVQHFTAIIQQSNNYAVAQATPAIVAKAKADAHREWAKLFPADSGYGKHARELVAKYQREADNG